MSSISTQNKEDGHLLLDGHHALISLMMNHVKFSRNYMLQKISVHHGNIWRVTFLISLGVTLFTLLAWLLHQMLWMLSQESSSLMILNWKVIKRQEKDGSKVCIFITQMTSSSLRSKLWRQEIVLLWQIIICSLQKLFLQIRSIFKCQEQKEDF